MSRFLCTVICIALLGSCGSRYDSAPRNLDDACSILDQRPSYLRAFRAAQRDYGVPIPTIMAMIYQESKFISNNRTPHQYVLGVIPVGRQSTAFGYSQALDGTWAEYQRKKGGSGARRDDIFDAADFMGWYMQQTVEETGVAINDTRNQYLAYHDGRTGFKRGTYRSKPWLVRISNEVAARAVTYDAQLRSCRKI